jgi:hypothetical protein
MKPKQAETLRLDPELLARKRRHASNEKKQRVLRQVMAHKWNLLCRPWRQ